MEAVSFDLAKWLRVHHACSDGKNWAIEAQVMESPEYAYRNCKRGDWLIWAALEAGVPVKDCMLVFVSRITSILEDGGHTGIDRRDYTYLLRELKSWAEDDDDYGNAALLLDYETLIRDTSAMSVSSPGSQPPFLLQALHELFKAGISTTRNYAMVCMDTAASYIAYSETDECEHCQQYAQDFPKYTDEDRATSLLLLAVQVRLIIPFKKLILAATTVPPEQELKNLREEVKHLTGTIEALKKVLS